MSEDEIERGVDASVFDDGAVRKVGDLSFSSFRSKLVVHFDILFGQNKLVWPRLSKKRKTM